MARHRAAKRAGIHFVDTTVKSGMKWLAPSWDMVMGHKGKTVSDSQYTEAFLEMMAESQNVHEVQWDWLVGLGEVALACYCGEGNFCHRYLLVELVRKYCEGKGIAFEYAGELS